MQQYKFPEFETRRNGFMKDIRNLQRESIKKRARSQMVAHTTNEELSELINASQNRISNQELAQLIKYANKHYHKAVAHIGNLVIDGVVKISQLERFTLEPDYQPVWLWLIEVLVEKEYCTIGLFQHCIKTIAPNRLEKAVKHSLSILYKITASNMYSSFLMRDENILLAIINATFRPDSASRVAYLLLHLLISKEAAMEDRFKVGILRERLVNSIKNGLLSNISIIKRNCCRIMRELAVRGVLFNQELNHSFMRFVKSDDFCDHARECLEYLNQYVLAAEREEIVGMIDLGLLFQLARWKDIFELEQREEIGQIIDLSREIKDHTSDMGPITRGISRQLDRLNLLSYRTIIQN